MTVSTASIRPVSSSKRKFDTSNDSPVPARTGSPSIVDTPLPSPPVSAATVSAIPAKPRVERLLKIVPAPAPRPSCYLAVKNEYQDRPPYGEHYEGHAQVIVPKVGYFGLGIEGYFKGGGRAYTMEDPLRMHNPDTVFRCALKQDGLDAMKAEESELTSGIKRAPYDRAGVKGPNCLIAAARVFTAGTGAALKSYDPAGTLPQFSKAVEQDLAAQKIPFARKDGKDVKAFTQYWDDMPDKDLNIRGGGVERAKPAAKEGDSTSETRTDPEAAALTP
jgi:hypothetical protein